MGEDNNINLKEPGPVSKKSPELGNDTLCLIIAAVQVLGGIAGVGIYFYQFGTAIPSLMTALALTPVFWIIYAGILLWNGSRRGLTHSIILQAIQIPVVFSAVFSYKYALGLELTIGWFSFGKLISVNGGSTYYLGINTMTSDYGFGINLIALGAMYYLIKVKKKLAADTPNLVPTDHPMDSPVA